MLKAKWTSINIRTNKIANEVFQLINKLNPSIGAFDTEATGLHIIYATPFLFQFGFLTKDLKFGYSFVVDLELQPELAKAVIIKWHAYISKQELYLAHNVRFDLNMLKNINLEYTAENLSDTMYYIRYAHDALGPEQGGPPLGLKNYATRYIDRHAKTNEKVLAGERADQAKTFNLKLKQRLSHCKLPDSLGNKYKSFTLSAILMLFKDPIMDVEDLPQDIKEAYANWKTFDLPLYLQKCVHQLVESDMIRYDKLNRENVIKYAHYDIIYVLEIYMLTTPVIKARKQEPALEIENSLIYPFFEMERCGFNADKEYLLKAKKDIKDYIILRRAKLFSLTHQHFAIGQHAVVKKLLNEQYKINVLATNTTELNTILSNLIIANPNDPIIEVIKIIQELRTLEKWYSVYIIRFLKDLTHGRLYTTINQVGTVSGRVTSNFQQFPRKPITTWDGKELFHPRKVIKVSGGDYNGLMYLDYSQIELRFQAFYTILVGHPDMNLCRAYMPYKCHYTKDGQKIFFNYKNKEHIKKYKEYDWHLDEAEETLWTPVDVHGATTTLATGLLPTDEGFKAARYTIGKRTNFAKNYGAKYGKIRQMFPDKTEEECKRIDGAYYSAFPGVKEYHNYCYNRAGESNTTNLFDVKYYNVSGHKLINMLVQGSAAFYLKKKIRELYDYMKLHNIKSRLQMQIHDELCWEKHKDESDVFFEFKRIMEDWDDTLVPLIADMEAAKITWADKQDIKTKNDLRTYFSV